MNYYTYKLFDSHVTIVMFFLSNVSVYLFKYKFKKYNIA